MYRRTIWRRFPRRPSTSPSVPRRKNDNNASRKLGRPEPALPVVPVALRRVFLRIGSLWRPLGPREQWEATSLCGSQPPMRSPSLFSHCHFRISTHSSHIPPRPPPYRSTSSPSSSSLFFALFPICLNGSTTLRLKVRSVCLQIQEWLLS